MLHVVECVCVHAHIYACLHILMNGEINEGGLFSVFPKSSFIKGSSVKNDPHV